MPVKSPPDAIEVGPAKTNVNPAGNFSARIRVFVEKVLQNAVCVGQAQTFNRHYVYVTSASHAQRKPRFRRTFSTKTRIRAEKFPAGFTLVFAGPTSIASGGDFTGICTGGRQHLAAAHQRTHQRRRPHSREH